MNNLLPSLIYDIPFIIEPVVYLGPGITHAALHISRIALGSGGDGGVGNYCHSQWSGDVARAWVTCQFVLAEIVSSRRVRCGAQAH